MRPFIHKTVRGMLRIVPRPVTQIVLMRKNGIKIPRIAYAEAKRVGLELAVLCAVLEQESSGGENVFGHDPTIFIGAGKVTRKNYLHYRSLRDANPANRRCQGVGPMQLTYWGYQDRADKLGGCWNPTYNVRVGAGILSFYIAKKGLFRALTAYNGSSVYARKVLPKVYRWREILR